MFAVFLAIRRLCPRPAEHVKTLADAARYTARYRAAEPAHDAVTAAPRHASRADHLWHAGGWQADVAASASTRRTAAASPAGRAGRPLGPVGAAGHAEPALARVPARHGRAGRAPRPEPTTASGPGAKRCTRSPRRIDPDDCRRSPPSSTWRCSRPATPRSASSTTCTTSRTARRMPQPEAMSLALIEAAREAGIALTLLPVLYMSGGFDGRALTAAPAPLRSSTWPATCACWRRCARTRATTCASASPCIRCARCRSRRMRALLATGVGAAWADPYPHRRADRRSAGLPGHARCAPGRMAARSRRGRCALVPGACHPPDRRTKPSQLARSGAVAGLCPTTEANLGDGLFPLAAYLDAGGTLGIGSDSHISVSPVEELRWLEYGQRLTTRHRNIAARRRGRQRGRNAVARGACTAVRRRPGMPVGALRARRARRPDRAGRHVAAARRARRPARCMDSFLFAGNTPLVRDVMVGGRWQVRDFSHAAERTAAEAYRVVVERLAAA